MVQPSQQQQWFDEEECLGFGVFVAELELIIGSSKGRKPDQTVLLELLQKLQASIISTRDTAVLKQHQKRCEAALYDIIYKGACAAVCSLVYVCLSRLYTTGDLLPLYARVNGLQVFLQDKNSTASEAARLSVMGLLAHLEHTLGRCVAASALESMAIAVKAVGKGSSNAMKAAGLKLAASVVEGLPQTDRNMAALQAEAWKLYEKQVKDRSSDELRAAAAGLLASLCKAGGAVLWGSAGYYAEEALKTAVTALEDAASQATREAYALALAELSAAASSSNPCLVAALDAEKKPAKRQQLEKTAGGMFKAALVMPFVEAAVAGNKAVTSALALGWSCFAASLSSSEPDALVNLAVKAVAMLEQCSKAAAEAAAKGMAPDTAANIGACLSGGEMPAASAAVIYFIRTAVISRLPEPGQRQLLSALATAASHAIAPPVIVAAMEGCGVLLELLGEIHDEAAIKAVQNAATSKLSASSTAVRHQAAAVLAALALSSPPLLAVLFGECLEGVETFCQQLMMLAAPYTKRGAAFAAGGSTTNSTGTGTPRGAPDSQIKHCIDGLHGNALAVAALLVAPARSALGAPSRLTSSVFWIAKRMISQPYCSCPWAVAAEREAGYIMLGSMCAAAPPSLLEGRSKQQQVLELFSVALGPTAAEALTDTAAAAADGCELSASGDLELAVACWWRAAALQALSAYVMGIMGKGLAEDAAQQVRLIAAMLSPLLEAVATHPSLADPARAAGAAASHTSAPSSTSPSPVPGSGHSPRPSSSSSGAAAAGAAAASAGTGAGGGQAVKPLGPVAAAAAALLQLRLLEVFFFLPAAQLWGSCHEQLLQLCCRQLLGVGGSRVSPDCAACVAASSLKHMLNSQDALLGPWMPGRDMLEDELRTFVGERGGPQQHPWEVGAAFTAGFITYSQALLPPDADGEDGTTPAAAAQPAPRGAAAGSAAGPAAGSILQPLGGSTMRRSTLLQGPSQVGPAGPQQQHAQPAVSQPMQARGVDRLRLTRRFMPYPQPYPLGPALLEAQMWLLGKLLSVVNTPTLLQVLEVLLGAVGMRPGQSQVQRAANCTAVAMAALAGLVPLAHRTRSEGGAGDKVASKVLQLASCMLEDQVYDTCLSRAGAELMAVATCLGSAALARNQVKAIAEQLMAEAGAAASTDGSNGSNSSAELRSVLCLVLGSIYRSRGGSVLQAAVPDAVEALVAVASRPVGVTHIWALHGLWLVAGAAGVGYAAHVKQSLQLALELLVSSFGDHPLLQPAAAQLANAMVAVLGPQFTLGSLAYSRCKTLVTDNTGTLSAALAAAASTGDSSDPLHGPSQQQTGAAAGADGLRGLAATCSELEQVLFAQQLILFAPGAVPPTKHLPLLLLTLSSSRPTLRKAAAATLWHLADRNAVALSRECIEGPLLAALDGESEASIASQMRATLTALLAASAPARPGYWVKLLAAVALAAGPAAAAAGMQGQAAATTAFRSDTPDDEDDDGRPQQQARSSAAAAGQAAAAGGSAQVEVGAEAVVAAAIAKLPATPRLRTRLFAAEQLLSLFAAVGPDSRHRHPRPKYGTPAGAAGEGQQTDFLVQHLQALVDLGFKLTTGSAESLRPSGAQLLQQLLRFFGAVPDPDVPEMLLLEQYQAQFVAALRAALKPGAAPALAVCGGTLATSFLSAGLAAGDGAVMRRLMDLLVAPLQVWQVLLYGGFAESVGVRARVALLQAHAQCASLAQAFGRSSSSGGAGGVQPASEQGALGVSRPGCFSPNSTINNELCCSIVVKSQAPYLDMLLLLWWGVLLDCAAFTSTLPGVLQNHKSLLFGHTTPEVVEDVQGTYAAAWPSVLVAVASNLPGPAQLTQARDAAHGISSQPAASGSPSGAAAQQQDTRQAAWSAFVDLVSSGADLSAKGGAGKAADGSSSAGASAPDKAAALWHQQLQLQCVNMHAVLLEVCLMLLSDAAAACAAVLAASSTSNGGAAQQALLLQQHIPAGIAAARRVAVGLQAVQLLLTQQHIQAGLVSTPVCCDIVIAITAVAEQVLLPWLQLVLLAQQQPSHQQPAADSQEQPEWALLARDKVFGAVLLASSELLHVVAASMQQQPAGAADAAGQLSRQVLEAVLALSSIAVPFVQEGGASSCGARCMPALTVAAMQASTAASPGLQTWQPGPEAVAACSSLCRAGACLVQQEQQQQGAQPCATAVEAVVQVALRLVLTAAPGGQLQAAQQLLGSCLQAGPTSTQQHQPAAKLAVSVCNTLCDAVTAAVQQLCSSSQVQQHTLADAAARLPVLLGALLQAASCCSSCPDTPGCAAAADRCCGVLLWSLRQYQLPPPLQQQPLLVHSSDVSAAAAGPGLVACKVLEAVRLLLQDAVGAAAGQQQQQGRVLLANQAAAAITPQVAALIHSAVNAGCAPLAGNDLAAVAEGLKVLLLLSTLMAPKGEAAQAAVLGVLVPLLIEVAKPPGATPATPVLRSMACKLVSAMPTSAAAAAFRVVVTGLPAASKERLQGALRENAAAEQAAGGGGSVGGGGAGATAAAPGAPGAQAAAATAAASRKPAIQLKMNFQLPAK